MPLVKTIFGDLTGLTITLGGLADNAIRGSAVVDNSDGFLDAELLLQIKLSSTGSFLVSPPARINVYVYSSIDGVRFTTPSTGANEALAEASNLKPLGFILPSAAGVTVVGTFESVAFAFGGQLPRYWGIAVENKTGVLFDALEANFVKQFKGKNVQYL